MNEKYSSTINYLKNFIPLVLASTTVLSNSSVAKAINFNFSYQHGVTFEQIAAMETAGMIWSDYLADDITVNIHVESTNVLDSNIVGGALPGIVADYNYGKFRSLLNNDSTSFLDNTAYSSLSVKQEHGHEKFTAWFDTGISGYTEDSGDLNLTRANAKAIGAINPHKSGLDGYILMSDLSGSSASWNYDLANDSVNDNSLDYLSVATHEIGHILGFVSGVDQIDIDKYSDWNSLWSDYADRGDGVQGRMDEILDYATPLDMFRYSSKSKQADMNNLFYNVIDFSTSQQAYFSLDGGDTLMYQLAQGQDDNEGWGDGYQASHWKQKNSDRIGIMDPLIDLGQRRQISNRDMVAFDVIGYDLTANGHNMIGAGNAANGWLVTGVGTDLSTLEYQAKDKKVKKHFSNGDASWIDWAIAFSNTETSDYTQDLTDDIEKMIEKSEVYDARRGGWGQTAAFWQEAYLQEFKWQTIDLEADSQAVPEPGSTFSLFGLGVLSLGSLLKRKKK